MSSRRRRFSFRVELGPDALWDRLQDRDDVRESTERAPEPAPPYGAPVLASRTSPHCIELRRWAGSADAESPVVVVELEPEGPHWVVHASLEPAPSRRWTSVRRWISPAFGIALVVGVTAAILGNATALLWVAALFAFPAALVATPVWLASALWDRRSNADQADALRALVGEVFTPLALPGGDGPGPFR